jgi:hypothetical protein
MRPTDVALWACVPGGLAWLVVVEAWSWSWTTALQVLDEVMRGG